MRVDVSISVDIIGHVTAFNWKGSYDRLSCYSSCVIKLCDIGAHGVNLIGVIRQEQVGYWNDARSFVLKGSVDVCRRTLFISYHQQQ